MLGREGELGSELRRAPGQRDTAAAVSVIVNQRLVAKRFRLHNEARRTEWHRFQASDLAIALETELHEILDREDL